VTNHTARGIDTTQLPLSKTFVAPAARIAELEAALEELRQSNEELREALKRARRRSRICARSWA
jgi:HAMP domain-containing protein